MNIELDLNFYLIPCFYLFIFFGVKINERNSYFIFPITKVTIAFTIM